MSTSEISEWKFPEQPASADTADASQESVRSLQYTIAKQLPTAHTIHTDYGVINLDEELSQIVEDALRTALQTRLDQIEGEAAMSAVNTHGKPDSAHDLATGASEAIYEMESLFIAIKSQAESPSEVARLAKIGAYYALDHADYFGCQREMLATEKQEVQS